MKKFLVASMLALVFAASGCKWTDACKYLPEQYSKYCPSATPTPTPTPVPVAAYTVVRGQRVDKTLTVPASIQFDITNLGPTSDAVEAHLAWAVTEGGDWNGGNPSAGTYSAAAKDYKLKVYSVSAFAGERRIFDQWNPALTYTFKLEITSERTSWTAWQNGTQVASTSVDAEAPEKVTLSYGWPPTKRNGAEGAKLTNIKYSGE